MSRRHHDGTSAGAKLAEASAKPFVVERWSDRSFTYQPVKGQRHATLENAVKVAKTLTGRVHIVTFDEKTRKPRVVWES